jgi:hypothetical protein
MAFLPRSVFAEKQKPGELAEPSRATAISQIQQAAAQAASVSQ